MICDLLNRIPRFRDWFRIEQHNVFIDCIIGYARLLKIVTERKKHDHILYYQVCHGSVFPRCMVYLFRFIPIDKISMQTGAERIKANQTGAMRAGSGKAGAAKNKTT